MDKNRPTRIVPVNITEACRAEWLLYCKRNKIDVNHYDHRLPFAEGFSAGVALGLKMAGHKSVNGGIRMGAESN